MIGDVSGGFAHRVGPVGDENLVVFDRVEGGNEFGAVFVGHIQAVFADERTNIKANVGEHSRQHTVRGRLANIEGASHRVELIDSSAGCQDSDNVRVFDGAHGRGLLRG